MEKLTGTHLVLNTAVQFLVSLVNKVCN